jgi:hypothetical protein
MNSVDIDQSNSKSGILKYFTEMECTSAALAETYLLICQAEIHFYVGVY